MKNPLKPINRVVSPRIVQDFTPGHGYSAGDARVVEMCSFVSRRAPTRCCHLWDHRVLIAVQISTSAAQSHTREAQPRCDDWTVAQAQATVFIFKHKCMRTSGGDVYIHGNSMHTARRSYICLRPLCLIRRVQYICRCGRLWAEIHHTSHPTCLRTFAPSPCHAAARILPQAVAYGGKQSLIEWAARNRCTSTSPSVSLGESNSAPLDGLSLPLPWHHLRGPGPNPQSPPLGNRPF
jgi:hypothetical protein